MFGIEPKLGLARAQLPEEMAEIIYNEDQLKMALNEEPEAAEEVQAEIEEAEEVNDDENPCSSEVSF